MIYLPVVLEPDVQRFSISTLTAVALMDGIVESLIQRYLYEATLKIKAAASIFSYSCPTSSIARQNRRRRRRGSSVDSRYGLEIAALSNMKKNRKKYLRKAQQASEGVRCDIQALIGITDVSLYFLDLDVSFFISSFSRPNCEIVGIGFCSFIDCECHACFFSLLG